MDGALFRLKQVCSSAKVPVKGIARRTRVPANLRVGGGRLFLGEEKGHATFSFALTVTFHSRGVLAGDVVLKLLDGFSLL